MANDMKKQLLVFCLLAVFSQGVSAQYKEYHGDGPDDWLRLLPVSSAFVLKVCGVESSSNWKSFIVSAGASGLLTCGVTYGLKHAVHDMRPDGTDNHAFPSGHAAVAFAGAHVLWKEYRGTSIWIPAAGYAVAAATAVDRVHRNRHHWDDVVAGAAIGVASTELGYWLSHKLLPQNGQCQIGVSPGGVTLLYTLH